MHYYEEYSILLYIKQTYHWLNTTAYIHVHVYSWMAYMITNTDPIPSAFNSLDKACGWGRGGKCIVLKGGFVVG